MTTSSIARDDHPSPHRGAVKLWALMGGLVAGPFGWIAQLLLDYGLSSDLCMARRSMGQQPSATGESVGLIAVNLVCLALALSGMAISWHSWRKTQGEKPGGGATALETGEGRSRFLALIGILVSAGFAFAILFNTVEPLMVSACWTPES